MADFASLRDVIGFRGEKIVELCLTKPADSAEPLFRPGFLGDKWPALDFYVELVGVSDRRPYFFAQSKATSANLPEHATSLKISSTKEDVSRLLQMPGPTYLLGVHVPTQRVFAKSVHEGVAHQAITRIELEYELTAANLRRLYEEVRDYWRSTRHKPNTSVFA